MIELEVSRLMITFYCFFPKFSIVNMVSFYEHKNNIFIKSRCQ